MARRSGYKSNFISKKLPVPHPELSPSQKSDVVPVSRSKRNEVKYIHFSVVMSKKRKFPYYTAANIHGGLFRQISRHEIFGGSDRWSVDERVEEYQWGNELYRADKSDFHKGHMTKREDPQWGRNPETALEAARSTFYFTNAVPQVREMNSREWRSLEAYILKKKTHKSKLKINLFTGPVLDENDPLFVTKVDGQDVQIPVWFWKVIYFATDKHTLCRVGFLMGQKDLLLERKIAKLKPLDDELEVFVPPKELPFTDFEDAATYQVNINTIEDLSGLTFPEASEPFTDDRLLKVVLREVEVDDGLEVFVPPGAAPLEPELDFELEGLVL